jgi:hypothetical protein
LVSRCQPRRGNRSRCPGGTWRREACLGRVILPARMPTNARGRLARSCVLAAQTAVASQSAPARSDGFARPLALAKPAVSGSPDRPGHQAPTIRLRGRHDASLAVNRSEAGDIKPTVGPKPKLTSATGRRSAISSLSGDYCSSPTIRKSAAPPRSNATAGTANEPRCRCPDCCSARPLSDIGGHQIRTADVARSDATQRHSGRDQPLAPCAGSRRQHTP